jgi:hypothetical protein
VIDAPAPSTPLDRAAAGWEREGSRAAWRARAPHVVLAATVAVSFALNAVLALATPVPRVFLDELIYMDAADAFAHGHGLQVRGEPYVFAALYPLLLAPLLATADRETAYEVAKVMNALAFALAAVPVYLLARRLLSAWPSVGVAALSIAIPSGMYASVLMTESVAYLVSCTALLAIALAVERPTAARQIAALAVIGAATLVRPQFVALYVALLVSLLAVPFLVARRPTPRSLLRGAWPTLGAGIVGTAVIALRPLVTGGDALGAYEVLWRGYPPLDVGRYFVYELANLGLYLAVVPLLVAPIVVCGLVVRARAGSEHDAAFAALFLSANVALVAMVAAFDSFLDQYLHDRYLFYLAPLWFIVLFHWFVTGAPRPRLPAVTGVCLVLVVGLVPLSTTLGQYKAHWRFHALGSAFPTEITQALGSATAARVVIVAIALVLAAALLHMGARALPVAVIALLCVFLLNGTGAWATAHDPVLRSAYPLGTEDKLWVDRAVPADASVTTLLVSCERAVSTERWQVTANSISLTEFFNSSVGQVVHVGGRDERTALRLLPGGSAVYDGSGRPVQGAYLVTQSSVPVRGRALARGTAEPLVLWELDGNRLAFAGVRSGAQLRRMVCGAARRS